MLKPRATFVFFAVLLIGFVAGLVEIQQLRLGQGDAFPPYSTFRADPMGAKALYESLGRIANLRVSRNLTPLDRLREPQGALLFLGLAVHAFLSSPKEELQR